MIPSPRPGQACYLRGITAGSDQLPELEGEAGPCMVTDMVRLRKLTQGGNCQLSLWKSDLGGKPVLKTKLLLEMVSVFGRFWGYQIVPNFTNFYQKRATNALEQADKGQLTGVFHGRFY